MEEIIKKLQKNPIFKMSLGSKELFHSNFLEYLWDINQNAFISIVNNILPNTLEAKQQYILGREKKNFDICIYHKEKKDNNKEICDLVIENKVKSIPYKEQLDDYVKKADNPNCRFILLTLSDNFPDKGNIKEWTIVKYDQLKKEINNCFLKTYICSTKDTEYISDYCDFIEQLCLLMNEIIPTNILKQPLFNEQDINNLKAVRLHDLYIKLRCSWFAMTIKNELNNRGITPTIIHKYEDRKPGVNLNVDINQGNGQIAVWICNNALDSFEIVIQGNQYRHGVNQYNEAKKHSIMDPYTLLNNLYNRMENGYEDAFLFLNFNKAADVYPDIGKTHFFKRTKKNVYKIPKKGPYCCYEPSCIYRYQLIEKTKKKTVTTIYNIQGLIEKMINDIDKVYPNIPKI